MSSGKKPKIVAPPPVAAAPITVDLGARGGEDEEAMNEKERKKKFGFEQTTRPFLSILDKQNQQMTTSGRMQTKTLLG